MKVSHSKAVAIIGGGLAGLTLSISLARKGISVTLFEKEVYPFNKVCGEYIAMESWNYLVSLGVPLGDLALPLLKKLKVTSPNGNYLNHALEPGGFGISRLTLDYLLSEIAKREGVMVLEGTKVEDIQYKDDHFIISTLDKVYEARAVVGSYGKRANLDVKLQRKFIQNPSPTERNYVGIKYHIKTDLASDTIELHNFKDGYCGISKVDGDKYCMCYLTKASNLQKYGTIKKMEENVLSKNPFLKYYFSKSIFLTESPQVISQINFETKEMVVNHMLMCGDAAGLIAPLCGNGMSMAMHSGKLLSELIPDLLDHKISRKELEDRYTQSWRQNFSTRLLAGNFIQHTFGKESMTNAVIGTLKHFPGLVSSLEALTHGKGY